MPCSVTIRTVVIVTGQLKMSINTTSLKVTYMLPNPIVLLLCYGTALAFNSLLKPLMAEKYITGVSVLILFYHDKDYM